MPKMPKKKQPAPSPRLSDEDIAASQLIGQLMQATATTFLDALGKMVDASGKPLRITLVVYPGASLSVRCETDVDVPTFEEVEETMPSVNKNPSKH
jgi:hypothetical protein